MLHKHLEELPVDAAEAFKIYFSEIKNCDLHESTELTLRAALHNLLTKLAQQKNPKIKVIHEPKRDDSGRGAPDFKFKIYESILGYLENKKTKIVLDQILKSDQIAKYKRLSDNLLLTNYLQWMWLKNGIVVGNETLALESDVGNPRAHLDLDKAEKVNKLIGHFFSTTPKGIGKVSVLALELATRCHDLREFMIEELIRQEREHQEGRLFGLFNVFKKDVFHELTLASFADAFAQMLGYGLFLARINGGTNTPITLINAKQYIPINFELIRELVDFLDELDKLEYDLIRWLIEEILSLLNNLDLTSIKEDLSFTKTQGRLWAQTEEERLLFAKDPYVYFYEDFLKAYDRNMRKSRGIYYTPPPVVNLIVRAINDILKKTFGIRQGLADRRRVTVLDFATGTGTFILEVLQQIFDVVSDGLRDQIIREHALKNLYGFEYLIAPYTIAHLKLSQFLRDKGFAMQPKERLQIYLTNTLEPINPQYNLLLPALSKEVEYAQEVKDKPILVITGNPPYSGHSQNPSYRIEFIETKNKKIRTTKVPTFIGALIDDYKIVDGKPLGEKNPKWLQDDYVKFIRFAQWKMDQVNEGIVGIITNHSFLDNPTFRGMRQSLMQTFNQIYVLDLHGNTKKKETSPDGSKDDNVFDIEQGVCISILVRGEGLNRNIFHADLWGRRKDKYRTCMETEFSQIQWNIIQPRSPFYLFIPQGGQVEEYEAGWKIADIFPINSVGITTARDDLTIQFTQDEVRTTIHDFSFLPPEIARMKYALGEDARDWKVSLAQEDLKKSGLEEEKIISITYRPFDTRYTYYTGNSRGFHCMPRSAVMKHMVREGNVGIMTTRQTKDEWSVLAVGQISAHKAISRYDIGYLFPLYLYNYQETEKTRDTLFNEPDLFAGRNRVENFSPDFRKFIDDKYQHHYNPEDIIGYIYAVLHATSYRIKYAQFLKMDFPRIFFTDNRETFNRLSGLGWKLLQAHLFNDIPDTPGVDVSKNDDPIEKPFYDSKTQHLHANKGLYFAPVSENVWKFSIGGYQVLDKYLKSRKSRCLSLDEKENIINIIKVLGFTIDQIVKIDQIWNTNCSCERLFS